MCTCASCSYTDRFSGLPDLLGAPVVMDHEHGWDWWPRGDPAGALHHAKAYREHAAACNAMSKPIKITGPFLQRFPTNHELVAPIAPNAAAIRWNAGRKTPDLAETRPASPDQPGKAEPHFPGLDRQPETAKIYTMKPKERKPIGRPPIAKGGAIRKLVTLDPETIVRARKLGNGKLSVGIREAVRRIKAHA